jgi:hypothetical protein
MSLDTMILRLDNWSVRSGASIVLTPGNVNYETGEKNERLLFKDSSGHNAYGSKAVLNTQKINLTIKPFQENVYARVQFSAPKQLRDSNYQAITEEELSTSLKKVESELASNGIETCIDNASISRLDINKDILPEENIESYSRLFSLLQANRVKDKNTYGVNGWLFKNGRTEYCIYNKLEEMVNNKKDITGLPETLRFEHRCLKSSKVKEFYKFTTISDLKKYGFNALEEKQAQTWKDNFFKYDIEEIETIVESQLRTEMEYFQAKYGSRFLSRYLSTYGAFYIASLSGGIEVLKSALRNMECSRLQIYRAERKLTEAIFEHEAMKPEAISRKSLGSLYSELKEKVCTL